MRNGARKGETPHPFLFGKGGTQPPSSGGAALFRTKNLGEGGLSPKQSGGKKSFPSKNQKLQEKTTAHR